MGLRLLRLPMPIRWGSQPEYAAFLRARDRRSDWSGRRGALCAYIMGANSPMRLGAAERLIWGQQSRRADGPRRVVLVFGLRLRAYLRLGGQKIGFGRDQQRRRFDRG